MTPRIHRPAERGVTVIEFALVLVTLLIIVFGMISIGIALWNYNTLSEATREGARYGSTLGSSSGMSWSSVQSAVQTRVQNYAFGIDLPAADITVSSSTGSNTKGSTLTVTSHYTYINLVPAFVGIPGSLALTSTASMVVSD